MVNTLNIFKIFEVSPTPTIIVKANSPHFSIVGFNTAYNEVTNLKNEYVIGQGLFETFPDNPHDKKYSKGTTLLKESFDRVIETRKTDTIAYLQYDIPIRGTDNFEVKFWQPKNIPVLNEEGEVEYILHTVTDITNISNSEIKLQASEIKYKELIQSMNAIIWEADAETFQYKYISPQAYNILGYDIEDWYVKGFWKDHVHPEDKDKVIAYSVPMIQKYKDHVNEYRMIAKDNSVVWISDAVSVIIQDGGVIKLRGVKTDITSKKKAEQTLLENQSKISNILKHSLDIICTIDANGIFTEMSAACTSILGYEPEELIGKPFIDFVYHEDKELSIKEAQDIIDGDYTSTFENRYLHRDGSIVYILWSAKWDDCEEVIYCIAKDGTYKKNIELQLKYSEQRFKNLVQHGADFIAILDSEANFTYASLNANSILGYNAKYLVGKNAFTFMHIDDLERVQALFTKLIQGNKLITDTFRYKNGDGKYQWMETTAIDMRDNPAVGGIVVNSRDVSEKKNYLEWHEYVNKATNNTIYDWDIIGDIVQWGGYVNDLFTDIDLKNTSIKMWVEKLHPKEKVSLINDLNKAISEPGQLHWKAEYKLENVVGEYLDIIEEGFFIRNKDGKAIRMIGALRDVTDRKRFETDLQISNQRYVLVSQATSDAIWDWDLTTNSLYWGDGFQKIFGHKPENLYKDIRSWNKLIHPKDYNRITSEIQNTLDTNASQWESEYRFLKSDGKYVYVYDRGFVHRDADGKAIRMVGAMQDIHNEKMKEVDDAVKLSISSFFTTEPTLESAFTKTIKTIVQKYDFSYGEIWMPNQDNSNITLMAHYGKGSYTIDKVKYTLDLDKGMAGALWKNKEAMFIGNIQSSSLYLRKSFAEENNFRSVWGYPIIFNNNVIAIIKFYRKLQKNNITSPINSEIFNLLGSEIQRKKAEVELNFFFDLSPDFLCIVGMDGRFIKANQKFIQEIGPIYKDGASLTYHEYTHPEDLEEVHFALEKLNSGKTTYNESRYKTITGEYIWVGWDTAALLDQKYLFTIGKDITARKTQALEIERSNTRLTETLESIQDGFFALDFNWNVTYWNKEAERILYTNREDIIGKKLWEAFPEGTKLKFLKEYSRTMTDRVIVTFEEYFPPLSLWFNVSAFPSDSGITVFFKDITEFKKESLDLLQFKNVFKNSKDEIAIISTVNDDIYLNSAYTDSLGYEVEQIKHLGGPQHAFASEDLAAEVFSSLLSGNYWKGDAELITHSRNLVSYHISGGPIFDESGKLIAVFLIHTNISQRKNIEVKLKYLYGDLKQQTEALAKAHKELEHFASVASNDLKEPLEKIQKNLQILKETYVADENLPYIQDAQKNSARLEFMIKGLLTYALSGNDSSPFEKVDLNEVLKKINKTHRDKIIDKFAIIDSPKMPIVKGHKSRLTQIFESLILNSITYCVERPHIFIDFESNKTHWLFTISDNGIGIETSRLLNIFELFNKSDHTNEIGSNGIGLAITKKLVEKYGGSIWVESEINKGTIFYFTISKDL